MPLPNELIEAFVRSGRTLANLDKDFPEWHKGRDRYYVWVVMTDSLLWRNKMKDAKECLSHYLVTHYERQPHVTILPAGFIDDKALQCQSVIDVVQSISPFEISLHRLSSFTGSPCYPVIDEEQRLRQLRTALREVAVDPNSQVDDGHYVPHLTVGLYDDCYPTMEIASKINGLSSGDTNPILVERVALVSYETFTIKGSLTTVADFWLGCDRVEVFDSTLFGG